MIIGHAEAGKTVQIGLRIVWELGHDPTLRWLLLSASQANPVKVLGVVRRLIEWNPRVREVFPKLRRGTPWNETRARVLGAVGDAKEYSVQAAGWRTRIMGGRFDRIVVDDPHDATNSQTPGQRKKVQDQFDSELQSRRTFRGRVIVVANAWHREDLPHALEKRGAPWVVRRYPLLDARKRSRWPEQFPAHRVAEIRRAVGALAFARMYLCIPLDDDVQRFREEWLEAAVQQGRQRKAAWRSSRPPVGPDGKPIPVFAGVDLSSGKSGRTRKTDRHAIVVIALWPDDRIQLLDIRVGKWPAPQLLEEMRHVQRAYDPLFWVEDNATQQLFVDLARDHVRTDLPALRVRGFTTLAGNKWDARLGVEGMSVDFESGRWIVPVDAAGKVPKEVEDWFEGLRYFTPADHTSDLVMASWIATNAARITKAGRGSYRYEGRPV